MNKGRKKAPSLTENFVEKYTPVRKVRESLPRDSSASMDPSFTIYLSCTFWLHVDDFRDGRQAGRQADRQAGGPAGRPAGRPERGKRPQAVVHT